MCSACGFPPAVGHWTDAGGGTAEERLRIRFRRILVLNSALHASGFKVRDDGAVPGIQLSDATGRTVICNTLDDVWQKIELLGGHSFDPLAMPKEDK